ncbi:MAG: UDP-N-acetylmuramate--L-alanine ligase [Candidatus Thorarchaeota archaeon]
MRILLSGGGTGGHIYPAIAIAQALKKQNPNHEILFIGAKGKMEIDIIRKAGFNLAEIWIDGFRRFSIFKNLLLPVKLIYSYFKSRKILKYFDPDIVVGTGGYVSAPVLSAAIKMGIPIVIQEQNAVMGLTNRSFIKRASKIFVAYEDLYTSLNKKYKNIILTGNPIREELINSKITKRTAIKNFELDPKKKCILVLGGSLGAKTINNSILENISYFLENDIQLIWQTGKYYYKNILSNISKRFYNKKLKKSENEENLKTIFEKIKIMPFNSAYTVADVVIARAGAITISELAFKKKPTIFVPSPNVTNDHQNKNIANLLKNNAILSLSDKNASKNIVENIEILLKDKSKQRELLKNFRELSLSNANKIIIDNIVNIPHDIFSLSNDQFFKKYKYAYFIGIGGIGMSSLAKLFKEKGINVFGYDKNPSEIINELKKINISTGFEDAVRFMPREILDNIRETIVIYTPAIPEKNEILNYIKEKEYALFKRSEILKKLTKDKFTIAIAGTHGKTSITAMIAHVLYECKENMLALVGGIVKKYNSNLIFRNDNNANSIFVIEADEYDKSFLNLHPNISLITSLDPDHLDVYKNKAGLEEGYKEFINLLDNQGKLIINIDAYKKIWKKIRKEILSNAISYSLNEDKADVMAENIGFYKSYTKFDYIRENLKIKNMKFPIWGYHNIENVIAVITICDLLGLNRKSIIQALETFPGIKRRFDYILNTYNCIFINDYAHHPTEIDVLLNSLKIMYPNKKLTVVFQPHLYTRTRDFSKEFAKTLSQANKVILLPIYPAREEPIKSVSSKLISNKIKIKDKKISSKEDLVKNILEDGIPELLITVGAGDIDELVEPIKNAILSYK